jgi:hypothetical protein
MASWTLTAQLENNSTLAVATDNHVWWNGTNFGDNITVGTYQSSTHITDSANGQRDTVSPVNNTKYIDSTHASINGGASAALPIPDASCGLLFTFSNPASVATMGAQLYAYDGVDDINAIDSLSFMAAEGNISTQWVSANGLNSALRLQDHDAPSSEHNFYVATSLSPLTSGLKSGKLKIVLSFI